MLFLDAATIAAFLSAQPQVVVSVAEASAEITGITCDVPAVFGNIVTSFPSSRTAGRWGSLRIRLRVQRLRDLTWSLRLYLYSKALGRVMRWTLRATTCERAARRAATKLVLASESLFNRSAVRRPTVSAISPVAPPLVLLAPPLQRPTAPVQPEPPVIPDDPATELIVPEPPIIAPLLSGGLPPAVEHPIVEPPPYIYEEKQREPVARRALPLGLRIRAEARVGHGVLPQSVFGGGRLHAALVMGRARVELGVGMSGAGPLVVPGDDATPRPFHASIQLSGCGDPIQGKVDLHLCAGFEGGRVFVGADTSSPQPWTLHLVMAPALTWWFGRHIGMFVGVSVGPALVRSNFYTGATPGMDALGERSTAKFLLAGTLGLEVRVPALQPRSPP